MKIVINRCYGGFSLSDKAKKEYCRQKDIQQVNDWDIMRNDPILVDIVEKMGAAAGDRLADLKIVDIPDDVNWFIQDYDGVEWVAERHRTWS